MQLLLSHHIFKGIFLCIGKNIVTDPDSLLNNTILDWSKLKGFADDNLNVSKTMIILICRVENIVSIGENGNQHFLLFPQCFQKPSLSGS